MEETILLNLEVDQGQAEKDLIAVNKAILNNKEAAQELTKAYKAGTITQEEYVEENIRLTQNLKKNQQQAATLTKVINTESNSRDALKLKVSQLAKEYDGLNTKTKEGAKRANVLEKELKELNTQLTKGDKAAGLFKNQIGNYPEAFKNAANGINVAGVSVGDIGSKLASFANPAAAAVGIVTALGAAYARSTIGAKDLEFAQNQLSSSITLATNQFARLISSAEDGEGILSQITTLVSGALFGLDNALTGKLIALNLEKLEDLGRDEIAIREVVNERLEENQEKLTELQAEQTTYNDKIGLTNEIIGNLRKNEEELLAIQGKQLEILQTNLTLNKDDEVAQTAVLEKNREISNIKRDTEKKVQNILRMEQNLTEAENKRLAILREENRLLAEADARLANPSKGILGTIDLSDPKKIAIDSEKTQAQLDEQQRTKELIEGTAKFELDTTKNLNAGLEELERQRVRRSIEQKEQEVRIRNELDQIAFNAASSIFASLSQLAKDGSEEQKALALTGIAVDTAAAIAGGISSSQDIPYPGNLAAMATTIATILANVAQAKSLIDGFAEGGYTGRGGKYEPKGVVHGNEYVIPSETVSKLGPSYFDKYLPGYADGGFVTGRATSEANAALITANAFKNLPAPVISAVEMTRVQNRVKVKEKLSTL